MRKSSCRWFYPALLIVLLSAPIRSQEFAPDSGEVTGRRYASHYFGFTYDVPEHWVVSKGDVRKRLSDAGEKILKDERNLEAAQKGRTESYNLLMVTSNEQPPAILTIVTEDVNLTPKIESARDYITRLQRMMSREGTPTVKPISDFERNDKQFAGFTVRMEVQGTPVYQRLESTLCHGYVLTFGVASQSQDSLESALASLKSLRFSSCK